MSDRGWRFASIIVLTLFFTVTFYVVLASEPFFFASRRFMFQLTLEQFWQRSCDDHPEDSDKVKAYNKWAVNHQDTISGSLFSAGTTWTGQLTVDEVILDVFCVRKDLGAEKLASGELSGSAVTGGIYDRIGRIN